jgi:hypothetical protein
MLALTSVLAMVAGFVILFPRIPPPWFYDAGASLGRFAFVALDVALLKRGSTARGQDGGG